MSHKNPQKKGNAPEASPYQNATNMDYKDTTSPAGNITLEDLNADFDAHTSDKPKKPRKRAGKPAFPLGVLPPSLKLFIEEAQKVYGVHPDFMGPAILYAAAVAVGKTYVLEMKREYYEPAMFWFAFIANSGTNKSGALKQAFRPISKWQKETYEKYLREKSEYDAIKDTPKKERLKEPGPKPVWEQRFTGDATPEALGVMMLNNRAGISIKKDELKGWIDNFDRYSKGSEQEEKLEIWSFGDYIVNRLGREPIHVHNAFMCVAGTIQESVLEGMGKEGRNENGFIPRFLFSWPDIQEMPKWNDIEMPEGLTDQYEQGINNLLHLEYEADKMLNIVRFTTEAKQRYQKYVNDYLAPLYNETGEERLQEVYSKFRVHAARLALILQMLWYAFEDSPRDKVELETMERAVKLAGFFQSQAERVYKRINEASPVDRLTDYKRKIYEALPEEFDKADGVKIADQNGMAKRTFGLFLAEHTQPAPGKPKLFEQPKKRGNYFKIY